MNTENNKQKLNQVDQFLVYFSIDQSKCLAYIKK